MQQSYHAAWLTARQTSLVGINIGYIDSTVRPVHAVHAALSTLHISPLFPILSLSSSRITAMMLSSPSAFRVLLLLCSFNSFRLAGFRVCPAAATFLLFVAVFMLCHSDEPVERDKTIDHMCSTACQGCVKKGDYFPQWTPAVQATLTAVHWVSLGNSNTIMSQ